MWKQPSECEAARKGFRARRRDFGRDREGDKGSRKTERGKKGAREMERGKKGALARETESETLNLGPQ
jgi:hypothetical protein